MHLLSRKTVVDNGGRNTERVGNIDAKMSD